MTLSAASLLCLAMAVYHEARGEPVVGQAGVVWVVINRMRNPGFPDTACSVIRQKGQFTFAWSTPRDWPAYQASMDVVLAVARGEIPDPTGGSLCFHRKGETGWQCGLHQIDIANQVFYTNLE